MEDNVNNKKYFCNNEELTIEEIVKKRKIILISIKYRLRNNSINKEIIITDYSGIKIIYNLGIESGALRFSNKKEFEKIIPEDYDEKNFVVKSYRCKRWLYH